MSLTGWKEKMFQRYLVWSCRPARICRHLQTTLPRTRKAEPCDRRRIRVAALQLEIGLMKTPLEFADEMHRHVRKAADAGAQLVVLPEYNNLPLLGLLPGIEKMEEEYKNKEAGQAQENNGEDISLAEIFRYMSPAVQALVHTIFSRLALAYGLYIMAGTYILTDNGAAVNRAFLYGLAGKLIGYQDKVHFLPYEAEWVQKQGTSFNVYDTPLGRLALPVCMDATYYETFRILEHKQADIALLPIANIEEYNYWLALRGIWPRVQESLLYGVKSALVGSLAGMKFTGRAGIYGPLEITPNRDGVLAEVGTFDSEAMAVANLDLEALYELRRSHPWRDTNAALYRRYFPAIYH